MKKNTKSMLCDVKSKKGGFTLIELLVVIAIIGILSSVVLASLSSARGKAQAVALVAALKSLQPAVAICNNGTIALNNTLGAAVCTGETAVYPTLTQLNVTTAPIVVNGTAGSQSLTITPTGHPVGGCNAAFTLTESSLTVPATCK